ncbi:hypothetical protein J3A83DRAFT_4383154 [Scleroderma citrinum]
MAEQVMPPDNGSQFTWKILLSLLNTLLFLQGVQWVYLQLPYWQAEFFFAVSAIAFFTLYVEMQHAPAYCHSYQVAASVDDHFGLWRVQVDQTIGPPPTDPPSYLMSNPLPEYKSRMTEKLVVLQFLEANPGISLEELQYQLD